MSRKARLRVAFVILVVLTALISLTEFARLIEQQKLAVQSSAVSHSAHRNLCDLQTVLMFYYQATGVYPDTLDNLYPKYMFERLENWSNGGASLVVYRYNKPDDLLNGDFVVATYTASWNNEIRSFRLYLDGRIREVED